MKQVVRISPEQVGLLRNHTGYGAAMVSGLVTGFIIGMAMGWVIGLVTETMTRRVAGRLGMGGCGAQPTTFVTPAIPPRQSPSLRGHYQTTPPTAGLCAGTRLRPAGYAEASVSGVVEWRGWLGFWFRRPAGFGVTRGWRGRYHSKPSARPFQKSEIRWTMSRKGSGSWRSMEAILL